MGKSGKDYIGIVTCKGKFLNGRNASVSQIEKNNEATSIIRSLNLKCNLDYSEKENYLTLPYKKFVVAADADNDGYHIVGLLYNFFHARYPSLLKIDFFYFMRTPVLTINKKLEFYSLQPAREYIQSNNISKNKIKYYKGLGTWTDTSIIGKRMVSLTTDKKGDELMQNIFSKDDSDFRKNWLLSTHPEYIKKETKEYEVETLNICNFLNYEMIEFSKDHCRRAIPCIYDGLNESQRKIIFSAFKRKLYYTSETLKVAQFAGYVSEHSQYHHGEDILHDTITKMAQRFVGSNNLPLFYNDGQFGSRLEMGKDASSGRYIYTKLEVYIQKLFRIEDELYLTNLEEDGEIIEKEHYLPILPLVLINGASGIGTGFSTNIPCYNPLTLVEWVKMWLECNGVVKDSSGLNFYPELNPWYRNFKGKIERLNDNKYQTFGILEQDGNKYKITEIPIGKNNTSISGYKSFLEDLEKEKIKEFDDKNCNDNNIEFIITPLKDVEINEKELKLIDSITTTNMVLFKSKTDIKKYDNVEDILTDFCIMRFKKYKERRLGNIKEKEDELLIVNNKIKFITEVNNKILNLLQTTEQLENVLEKRKYDKVEDSFKYLLNIPVGSLLMDKIEKLEKNKKEIENEIKVLKKITEKELWIKELDEFVEVYNEWINEGTENGTKKGKKSKKSKI